MNTRYRPLAPWSIAVVLLLIYSQTVMADLPGSSTLNQMFGFYYDPTNNIIDDHFACTALPDVPLGSTDVVATPIGLTNFSSPPTSHFIESGASKNYHPNDGLLKPYGTAQDGSSSTLVTFTEVNITLAPGGRYCYQSYLYDWVNLLYKSIWIYGGGQEDMVTTGLTNGDLGYKYAASGVESNLGVTWGTISSDSNYSEVFDGVRSNGFYHCYNETANNVGGTISPCDTSTYSWSMTH